MTLTTRLMTFLLVALALVLALFSCSFYLLTQTQLYRELDERAIAYLYMISATVETEDNGLELNNTANQIRHLSENAFQWAVIHEAGVISGSSHAQQLSEHLPALADLQVKEQLLDSQSWRLVRNTLRHPQPEKVVAEPEPGVKRYPTLTLVSAVPVAPVHNALSVLAWRLLAVSLATLFLVALVARTVCRRALLPVKQMANSTQLIVPDDLTSRLPVPAARDELNALGSAFNSLLARVHEALERQKQFTSEASHQLRTPLTAMLGQIEVALRRGRSNEEYQGTLRSVKEQAARLHQMIEMLLFLARADQEARLPNIELIHLDAWLPNYLHEQWNQHPRFDDLQIESPSGSALAVKVHPVLFEQAIGNLIENAFHYSEFGTPVTLQLYQQGNDAVLSVIDQGMGIDPVHLTQLFSPFFRSARARQRGIPGVGLGLAVASRIVGAFGGTITFQNNSEAGSTFAIKLPAQAQEKDAGVRHSERATAVSSA